MLGGKMFIIHHRGHRVSQSFFLSIAELRGLLSTLSKKNSVKLCVLCGEFYLIVISSIKCFAPAYLSMMNKV